jgi:hypothetical protein
MVTFRVRRATDRYQPLVRVRRWADFRVISGVRIATSAREVHATHCSTRINGSPRCDSCASLARHARWVSRGSPHEPYVLPTDRGTAVSPQLPHQHFTQASRLPAKGARPPTKRIPRNRRPEARPSPEVDAAAGPPTSPMELAPPPVIGLPRLSAPAHVALHQPDEPRSARILGRPTRVGFAVVCLLLVAVAVEAVILFRSMHHDSLTAVASSPNAAIPTAESWVKRNLDQHSRLIADEDVKRDLIGQGFPATGISSSGIDFPGGSGISNGGADYTYAILTPRLRSMSTLTGSRLAMAIANAIPIARLGEGPQAVTVLQVQSESPQGLSARFAADLRARGLAGGALARNRQVSADPALLRLLRAGALDLRASTVIAMLADAGPVRLQELTIDPAATAVGRPVRQVRLTVGKPSTLSSLLSVLPAVYRPMSTTQNSDHSVYMRWTPAVAPIMPVK